MATDIKISELNEITSNNDINHIIINDRENPGDEGITKKIKLENFLTPNIVQETNILDSAVTCDKIEPLAVDCTRIANNTITCNQIRKCTINNPLLDSNSVDSRVLNNNCGFTVKCLTVCNGAVNINNGLNGCLIVESGRTKLNTQTYTWPQSETADRFLKTDGAGNLSWDQAVPGESTALVFAEIMPVGTVVPWAGTGTVPDDKWLECNGNTFKGSDYPDLRDALGDIWGTHVGDDYFLPNLKGRVAVGAGTGSDGTDSCAFAQGALAGKYNHTLTYPQMPAHRHVGAFGENNTVGGMRWGNFPTTQGAGTNGGLDSDNDRYGFTTYAGGQSVENGSTTGVTATSPHNNIQPYAVTRYIIKAKPDDIQQFGMNVGPGLSALNASGGQTASIDLSSSEIGLKVSDDFQFDGSGKLELSLSPIIVGRKRVDYSGQKSTTKNGNWGSDNLPVSTELDLLMETNFTATSTSNKLHVKFEGLISNSNAARGVKLALFNGTTCVGATPYLQPISGNALTNVSFEFTPAPGNQTYQLRWGVSGDTGWVNRWGGYSPDYGGLVKSYLTIEEVSGTTYEVYTDPA